MIGKFFKQPYPLYNKPWLIIIGSIISVVLVMVVFEPFRYRLNSIPQLCTLIHFALMTLLGTMIPLIILPKIFKKFYNPQHWTVGKSLVHSLLFFLFLSIILFVYNVVLFPYFYIEHTSISFLGNGYTKVVLTYFLLILSIASAPIVLTYLLTRNSILKQNLQGALDINKTLSERIKSAPEEENETITLVGSTKEQVKTQPDNILYIEAADNYMDVYYLIDDKVGHKLLRSTIKQMEEQLKDHQSFIRCHRAYIVNMNQITNIEGNAQGYKLRLRKTDKDIPVSRTYIQALKDRIG